MAQTRVHLKHLLEDIRDAYPFPIEEAILTELIANCLDSMCTQVQITIAPQQRRFTIADNGNGMTPKQFEEYHDIAATTKVRGKGIGFAGVGAKLSLLTCSHVLSETKRRGGPIASKWWLKDEFDAPWENAPSTGMVKSEKGTAVSLHVRDDSLKPLLDEDSVIQIIRRHFYPLLDPRFSQVLSCIYPAGIKFSVNGEQIAVDLMEGTESSFVVRKKKRVLGIGILLRVSKDLPEEQRGLAISTYGKIIKRGWDWIAVNPEHPNRITGVVEVPDLVECLTTNKADFLKEASCLQKYYSYRKEVQREIEAALQKLGETKRPEAAPDKMLNRLQKELQNIVGDILPEFPELAPLFGRQQRGESVTGVLPDPAAPASAAEVEGSDVMTGDEGGAGEGGGVPATPGLLPEPHLEMEDKHPKEPGKEAEGHRRRPGLMLGFDRETGGDALAWLRGNTVFINALHPGYVRAEAVGNDGLYIMTAVACELSAQVEEGKSPLTFIRRFMSSWGSRP